MKLAMGHDVRVTNKHTSQTYRHRKQQVNNHITNYNADSNSQSSEIR